MDQRSAEWFSARKNRLTASSVGAVLDEAPYMTRDDVMRLMVREYHGAEREFTGNIATNYGESNEDGARWQYELETGNEVKPAFFDTFEDWLGASADGYVGGDGIVEIKCPYSKKVKPISEQPHYYSQIQVQLLCTGREWCDFYVWTPTETDCERVYVDQQWRDDNMPILRQFYAQYLDERDNNAAEHLEPKRVEINTHEASMLVAEYDDLSEAIDNATARKKEVMAALVKLAGGKDALIDGRKFTKVEKAGRVSYAKVVKEHCKGVDLEPYRVNGSSFWKLT